MAEKDKKKLEIKRLLALIDSLPPEPVEDVVLDDRNELPATFPDPEKFVSESDLKPGLFPVSLKIIYQLYLQWSDNPDTYFNLNKTLGKYFKRCTRRNYVHYLVEHQEIKKSVDELLKEIGCKVYENQKGLKTQSFRVSRFRQVSKRKNKT